MTLFNRYPHRYSFTEQTIYSLMRLLCFIRYMAFQTSIIHGKVKAVETLLKNMNKTDYSISLFNLFPPLHNAVHFEREEVTEVLLKHNFDVNQKFSADDVTPLHLAVEKQKVSLIKMLLKYGADVDAARAIIGQTSLLMAIRENNAEIVRLLLKFGADATKGIIKFGLL